METTTQESWREVVADYQQVCLLKRQGQGKAARLLLQKELPAKIAAWSHADPQKSETKREALEAMFQQEQQRVDHAWVYHELITRHLRDEVVPQICSAISREVKRAVSQQFTIQQIQQPAASARRPAAAARPRLAFDDVQGIIDLLRSEERNELKEIKPSAV